MENICTAFASISPSGVFGQVHVMEFQVADLVFVDASRAKHLAHVIRKGHRAHCCADAIARIECRDDAVRAEETRATRNEHKIAGVGHGKLRENVGYSYLVVFEDANVSLSCHEQTL